MTASVAAGRDAAARLVGDLQERLAAQIAALDGEAMLEDAWERPADGAGIGGRGSTRIAGGAVFERGGVNTSIVTGRTLPPSLVAQRPELAGHGFFAAGLSVVLHPRNPHAPTAHANVRYFEARSPEGTPSAWWFGGGADLTPYYPVLADVRHFHGALRDACERHDPRFYPAFKAWCDRYFYLRHRDETRGVGGIFYDYLDAEGFGEPHERVRFAQPLAFEAGLRFMADVGTAFAAAYLPLVERRCTMPFGEAERAFQLLRRGRYVEFNLIYDRGTHFGLQSGGRTESILMSLPPLARWAYDERPEPGSREAELSAYLRPRDWFAADPLRT